MSLGEGITFVVDNRNFNEWYIRVTADIVGSIEVAYQISNRHYTRTIEINGSGRYIIGDSRGPNGLNEIRLGAFIDGVPGDNECRCNNGCICDNGGGPYCDKCNNKAPRIRRHGIEFEQVFTHHFNENFCWNE